MNTAIQMIARFIAFARKGDQWIAWVFFACLWAGFIAAALQSKH